MTDKRTLDTVTLLGVDCLDITRLKLVVDICQERFTFGAVKLLTSLDKPNVSNTVLIPVITSIEAYSEFIIKDLDAYVDTPHVLLVQYDGFILNPRAWTNEFLQYDYIGAPWLADQISVEKYNFPKELLGKYIVGNGGFSLRSKKFLSLCAKLAKSGTFETHHPEDTVLCVEHRALLEEKGIKFAPVELAKKFSYEGENDVNKSWGGQFGFHGLRWTDISKWLKLRPDIEVDPVRNTIELKTV